MGGRKESFVQGLTEASSTLKEALGVIRDEGPKVYKYIQYSVGSGSVAGTAGRIVGYRNTADDNIVTCDVSDCDMGAGQLMATLTDGQYGWMQIMGYSSSLNVNAVSGSVGNPVVLSTTTDGTVKVAGAVTDAVIGILVDTTSSSQKIRLMCAR